MRKNQLPPRCPQCRGRVKTDGVLFGEPIPSDVMHTSFKLAAKCDLMLICGTSAVVCPFADLPRLAKRRKTVFDQSPGADWHAREKRPGVIIIEINAEPTPLTEEGLSDFLIQGKTGQILPEILKEVKKIQKNKKGAQARG